MSALRCPKCGSSQGFKIQLEDWRYIYVDGNNVPLPDAPGPAGGLTARVVCNACWEHIRGSRQQAPFIEAALAHEGRF